MARISSNIQKGVSLYRRFSPDPDDEREPLPYPDWGKVFCEFLARTGSMRIASQASGISYASVRRYRYGDKAPASGSLTAFGPNADFCRDIDDALDQAVDMLREEAWRRAAAGSDSLLMFLLKAHDPELYSPPKVVEHREDENALQIADMRNRLLQRFLPPDSGIIDVEAQEIS